jgi:hypothetical protein
MTKEKYMEKAIIWVNKKSIISLKAIAEGYEEPKVFVSKSTKEEIQPDLSFITHGGAKHYSIVALKEDNEKKLVVKWKVLSFLVSMKRGKLHLLAPRGHRSFTQKMVNLHQINAVVHAL